MNLEVTDCECCNELTYHVSFDADEVWFDKEEKQVVASLTEVEMTKLYFMLKEHKCQ